ncbi:MAG: sensor histidine kinase [Candidatus Kryptoniota bacterium]
MTIKLRIAAFFTIAYAAVVLILSYALYEINETSSRDSFLFALKSAAQSVVDRLSETDLSTPLGVKEDLQEAISLFENKLGILHVTVFDSTGREIISLNGLKLSAIRNSASMTRDIIRLEEAGRKYIGIRREFEIGEKPVGSVYVFASSSYLEESKDRLGNILIVLAPISIIIVAAGSLFISKRALKPLDTVAAEIDKIEVSGSLRPIPVPDSNDEIKKVSESFNDLVDKLQSLFQLERNFIVDASHELKTPLTVIQTEIEMLLMNPNLSQPEIDNLKNLQLEVERAVKIATDLIFFSRLELSGGFKAAEHVDVDSLVAEIVSRLTNLAFAKGVKVEVHLSSESTVLADRDSLGRALSNVIENAIKYSDKSKPVRVVVVKTERKGDYALFLVSDNGIGINSEDLPYIFNRFYRTKEARSGEIQGSGLGLSITKKIVEEHKGSIEITSRPDEGTSVLIKIPISSHS